MPLVAHSGLPSFDYLRDEGYEVLTPDKARTQDIRELHIGLLNMMPDAALRATERQFLRLVGSCNRIVQICIHPFSVDAQSRGAEAQAYLGEFYEEFEDLREEGLDALILTGANPVTADITAEAFWQPMIEVVDWAQENVCSILCSCLASHAMLKQYHGVERFRRPSKRWGVYSHRVTEPDHPLVRHVNTRFDAPRSHVFEVSPEQVEDAGGRILAADPATGWHLATSADGFRFVYFQGHPEYDIDSLLKEYKREMQRFAAGEREDLPPYPDNYLPDAAREILDAHRDAAAQALGAGRPVPNLPEAEVRPELDNTWTDTGKAIFNNWLGLVYQLTDADRRRPFMPGIDPKTFRI